jgi:hypothetical protein
MRWLSEQIVDDKPVQVFLCDSCERLTAAAIPANDFESQGVRTV